VPDSISDRPHDAPAPARNHPERVVDTLSVVIPVFNEEQIIRETVEAVVVGLRMLELRGCEVILSENGSTDRSRAICEEMAQHIPEVRVLTADRADYGAALRAGFLAASGDAVVNFDADYFDLDFVGRALAVKADIVVASKGIIGSHDTRVLTRRVVSRAFGWLVRRILGIGITETHGMKLLHRDAIEHLVPLVQATQDLFDTELLARSEAAGRSIAELPIRTRELRHSRTGILRRIPRTLWGLFRIRARLRRAHLAPARERETPTA
jgi:glycosyltransferase involved in cell wall biosynthesis